MKYVYLYVNLCEFIKQCVSGYRYAYPNQKFELEAANKEITKEINPDLFYQMLDKLIANAVDFSYPSKPILVKLINNPNKIIIQVINYGPYLSEGMTNELFNSMISIRDKHVDEGPHLGLGLFIAKLIVEFHEGLITAENLRETEGVCFSIII